MSIQKHSSLLKRIQAASLKLSYMGHATVDTDWKTNLLATPFHRLYIIESGTGGLSTESEHLVLEPGKAYLLPANLPCSYHCDGRLSQLFFHFNLSEQMQFDPLGNLQKLSVINYPADSIQALKQHCTGSNYADGLELVCAIYKILLDMNEKYHYPWEQVHTYSRCVADTINDIHKNLSAQLRIEELANRRFMSQSYLCRIFRKETGFSLKQYIQMQLIGAAQWQLSHTDASMEQISNSLGFCNQFYFSQCFKKHCRVSPLQYRNGTRY